MAVFKAHSQRPELPKATKGEKESIKALTKFTVKKMNKGYVFANCRALIVIFLDAFYINSTVIKDKRRQQRALNGLNWFWHGIYLKERQSNRANRVLRRSTRLRQNRRTAKWVELRNVA